MGVKWRTAAFPVLCALGWGCANAPVRTAVVPDTVVVVDTVRVETASGPDPALSAQLATLQLRLLERDAKVEELERQVNEAIREVVRAMARLQSLATRAEAASGIAEAEIALQTLRSRAGSAMPPEAAQAQRLLEMSTDAFNDQNYGGSLYLATQARSVATNGETRLLTGERFAAQPGEEPFEPPLSLQVIRTSNVRGGPGLNFEILFTVEGGTPVTGHSFVSQWVRISDNDGRSGWVFHSLVSRRTGG